MVRLWNVKSAGTVWGTGGVNHGEVRRERVYSLI